MHCCVFFKQNTGYEVRISDWSADVCSSDLIHVSRRGDFGRASLVAEDYGREAFGRVVVARDFGQALEARLGELSRLTRYRPARFVGLGELGRAACRERVCQYV